MNGNHLIKELTKLAQDEKLKPEEGIRVLLASHVDLLQNQHSLGDDMKKIQQYQTIHKDEFEDFKKFTEEWISKLETEIKETRAELRLKVQEIVGIASDDKNPLVKLGNYLAQVYSKSPWKAYVAIVLFLFVMNLATYTLIQAGLVGSVLKVFVPLGLPEEWIEPLLAGS